jgi:hypothetical protein
MRKRSLRAAIRQAVRQSNLAPRQKLAFGLALIFTPGATEAIEDYLIQGPLAEAGIAVDVSGSEPMIDFDKLEKLFQLLLEYIPQFIELFERFFPAEAYAAFFAQETPTA